MKTLNDYSPIRRVLISFGWMLFLFLIISVSAIYVIDSLSKSLDEVVVEKNEKVKIMNNILKLARERSILIQAMLLTKDPFEIDQHLMRMSAENLNYILFREQLNTLPLSDMELEILTAQHTHTAKTGRTQTEVAQLIINEQYEQAKKLFSDVVLPSQAKAMSKMEEFVALQQESIRQELIDSRNEITFSRIVFLLLAIISFITSIGIGTWMIKRLISEIDRRNRIEAELEQRVLDRTEKLRYIANHDSLTSLPNREMFTGQLELAIERARRNKTTSALFFMDLDGFKEVNDDHGHDAGDVVLVTIASRIKNLIRAEDALARLGGDEFTLLINDVKNDSDAKDIATKIIKAVNEPIDCKGKLKCRVGISIGIAYFPDDANEADTLLTRADDFMYVAKRSGKNRVATSAEEQDD